METHTMETLTFNYAYTRKKSRWKALIRPIAAIPLVFAFNMLGMLSLFQGNYLSHLTQSLSFNTQKTPSQITETNNINVTSITNEQLVVASKTNINLIQNKPPVSPKQDKVTQASASGTGIMEPIKYLHSILLLILLPYSLLFTMLVVDACIMGFIPLYAATLIDLSSLLRKTYPHWLYTFLTHVLTFSLRYKLYLFLISDKYPNPSSEDPCLTLQLPQWKPTISRWSCIVRRLLIIPHIALLVLIELLWLFTSIPVWLWCVATARLPLWYHNWTLGIIRWTLRISCYAVLYASNSYPKFSTKA